MTSVEDIELQLLLEGIYLVYGYDFRHYSLDYIKKRVRAEMDLDQEKTISSFQNRLLHDEDRFTRFLWSLSIQVTEMFRDPYFYLLFRTLVVPQLQQRPFIRVWHAGCSTGEEVYSMAILLHDEALYDRCRLYATDFNENVLATARSGIYSLKRLQEYTKNYQESGGHQDFSKYYIADDAHVIFREELKKNIVFSSHNLVTDGSFNVFDVIICRNVLIYFNSWLQTRVLALFDKSLVRGGFLGLGQQETIQYTTYEQNYRVIAPNVRIYQKKASHAATSE